MLVAVSGWEVWRLPGRQGGNPLGDSGATTVDDLEYALVLRPIRKQE
jgi:hypothetical protein